MYVYPFENRPIGSWRLSHRMAGYWFMETGIKGGLKMFAVFETGGLQFRVEEGTAVKVPHLAASPGDMVSIDKVLLIDDGENSLVGTPYLESASVEAEILNEGQAQKVDVYKFKRRTKYRKFRGHRQKYTEIKIKKITPPVN
jgi:large subunit ribosomal protein L21